MNGVGLVLEGGGMRGVYTGGILDYWIERELYFPYIVGVSAGACNAMSYISRQHGRNKKVTIGYIADPRYLSLRNLWRERSMFGMDFIFNQIPNELVYFDFNTFYNSPQELVIGTTDAHTGEAVFYRKSELLEDTLPIVRASSSLPFAAPPILYGGRTLYDGGVADPIPIGQSIRDGNERHVIVLTKPQGYRKKPFKQSWLAKRVYPNYPGLIQALTVRSETYNRTLDEIDRMEREGSAIVIRPSEEIKVGRMEKNASRLETLFDLGQKDAKRMHDRIMSWVSC